jgi:ribosomal protein L11
MVLKLIIVGTVFIIKKLLKLNKMDKIKVITVFVNAGRAQTGPPLSSLLGQAGINISDFCAQFNSLTGHLDPSILCRVCLNVNLEKRLFKISGINVPISFVLASIILVNKAKMADISVDELVSEVKITPALLTVVDLYKAYLILEFLRSKFHNVKSNNINVKSICSTARTFNLSLQKIVTI